LVPEKLQEPLKWKDPKRIFVNSMSDLFHKGVPDDYVWRVSEVMYQAKWHVFQVLTKRSERLQQMLGTRLEKISSAPHIWWGVSVENRRHGLPRIEHLRDSSAHTRFLSIEPLLEDLGDLDLSNISWVIVGGESGPRSRLMDPRWVERIFKQCREQKVPFFFKQWGGTRKARTGRLLHGRTYDEMPD
jgi:protein gp37